MSGCWTWQAAKQLQDMKPDELQKKLTEGNGDETKELQNSLVVKSIKEVPIEPAPSSPAAMPQVRTVRTTHYARKICNT